MAVKLIRVGNQYNAPLKEYLCDLLTDRDTLDATMGDVVRVIETNETYIKTSSGWKKTDGGNGGNGGNESGESSESTTQPATTTNFVNTIDKIPEDATPGSFYYVIEDSTTSLTENIDCSNAIYNEDKGEWQLELEFESDRTISFNNDLTYNSNFHFDTAEGIEDIKEAEKYLKVYIMDTNDFDYSLGIVRNPFENSQFEYLVIADTEIDDSNLIYSFETMEVELETGVPESAVTFGKGWNNLTEENGQMVGITLTQEQVPHTTTDHIYISFSNPMKLNMNELVNELFKITTEKSFVKGLYIISNEGPVLVNDNSNITIDQSEITTRISSVENQINILQNKPTIPIAIKRTSYPEINQINGTLYYFDRQVTIAIPKRIEHNYSAESGTLTVGQAEYTENPFGNGGSIAIPTEGSVTLDGSSSRVNITMKPYLLLSKNNFVESAGYQTLPYEESLYSSIESRYIAVVNQDYLIGRRQYIMVLNMEVENKSDNTSTYYKYVYSPLNTTVNVSLIDKDGHRSESFDVPPGTSVVFGYPEFSFLMDEWSIDNDLNIIHTPFVHLNESQSFEAGLYLWFDNNLVKIQLDQGD